MTKGEYRVGIDFNPSGNEIVANIKRLAADLIEVIEDIPRDEIMAVNEVSRLKALAQTAIEEGAMWAVKAATKRAP